VFRVRPAESADADALVGFRTALWPEGSWDEHAAEMAGYFAQPRTLGSMPEAVLVASDGDGALLGFVELSRRPYAEGCRSSPVGFLEGWYVVPERRRQGVGRALVAAAEEWARGLGCSEFASDALVDNALSTRAHHALGFEEVVTIRCFRKPLERRVPPIDPGADTRHPAPSG
jgi:aminoglycoside 6'-N-acetyltransferase I